MSMRTERRRSGEDRPPSPLVTELRDMATRLNELAEQLAEQHGLSSTDE